MRITGQLIDAVTGVHIWADRFERDLTEVFALQDEVTVAVVSAIQPKLLEAEIEMASRRRSENLTAYDLYLRGRKQFYLGTREGLTESLQLAHRALDLDPRYFGRRPCGHLPPFKGGSGLFHRSSIRPERGSSAGSLGIEPRRA